MIVDISAFVGAYPYRELSDVTPDGLLREMDRVGVHKAWVGFLPSMLHHDPRPGNAKLASLLTGHDRLLPVYTVDPGLPKWIDDVELAVGAGAVGLRVYPMHQGLAPDGSPMLELVREASRRGLPVILTVRFEDLRQRHPQDSVRDLPAAAVRTLARCDADARLIVTHAGREYVEEIHFGLTPAEQRRVCYDISWLWGPPSGDLSTLCRTVGAQRFVWGSSSPLRILDAPGAKLDLSDLTDEQRTGIESGNLTSFLSDS